jgi:hypothetical protein
MPTRTNPQLHNSTTPAASHSIDLEWGDQNSREYSHRMHTMACSINGRQKRWNKGTVIRKMSGKIEKSQIYHGDTGQLISKNHQQKVTNKFY